MQESFFTIFFKKTKILHKKRPYGQVLCGRGGGAACFEAISCARSLCLFV